jgi:hypothetical protein
MPHSWLLFRCEETVSHLTKFHHLPEKSNVLNHYLQCASRMQRQLKHQGEAEDLEDQVFVDNGQPVEDDMNDVEPSES